MTKINGQNQIDLNQFKLGARINQQDSDVKKSIFNQIDKDGDGVIEKGEYEGFVTARFKGKDGKPVERQMIKLKSLEKVFLNNPIELDKYASLLYNQALLIEGFTIEDPVAFSNLMCELMVKSVK